MSETRTITRLSTPMRTESIIHRPKVSPEGLQEIPSLPIPPVTANTVINCTPPAPKKLKSKVLEFLKPTVYKHEAKKISVTPCAPVQILDALSLAGVRKNPKPKGNKPKKKTYSSPRKLTVNIVDGKTDAMIHQYVSVYRLMGLSSKAKELLESKPRAGRFKIYGKYNPAALSSVLDAIIHLQPIPISTTTLVGNLLTYEACLRLGISNERTELKPLLTAIYSQISNVPVDNDLLAFVTYHLGSKDSVFKHTANVLCHQRFTKSVPNVKEFEKMVAKKPALQKAMMQIDQAHKARREAFWIKKESRAGDDAGDAANDRSGSVEETAEVKTVEIMLGQVAKVKEVDYEQQKKLLDLFKDNGSKLE